MNPTNPTDDTQQNPVMPTDQPAPVMPGMPPVGTPEPAPVEPEPVAPEQPVEMPGQMPGPKPPVAENPDSGNSGGSTPPPAPGM